MFLFNNTNYINSNPATDNLLTMGMRRGFESSFVSTPIQNNVSIFSMAKNVELNCKAPENVVKASYVAQETLTKKNEIDNIYNKELSEKLAATAEKTAKRMNTRDWCAKGVNDALEAAGLVEKNTTRAPSAYQLVAKYDKCPNLKKVNVSKEDLKKLPAGCIIVWKNTGVKDGSFGEHGHVLVTLGNGKEASDHIQEMKIHKTDYAVYVPVSGLNSKKFVA